MTTVSYINEFGGIKSTSCDESSKAIWAYCIDKKMYVLAAHIKGENNVGADKASRVFNEDIDHMLDGEVFRIGNANNRLFCV